jgi:taurine dioxygenase
VLYLNPGYSIRINEMSDNDSDQALAYLFAHQLQDKYRYRHLWSEGDVLMWDNMGTIHNAVADYTPQEPRLIKRFQVMADLFFHSDGSAKPLMELPPLDGAYA